MDAVVAALCKAIPEISGSCLTTLSGLAAMAFMHFQIGLDMSMVLIKAIILSIHADAGSFVFLQQQNRQHTSQ